MLFSVFYLCQLPICTCIAVPLLGQTAQETFRVILRCMLNLLISHLNYFQVLMSVLLKCALPCFPEPVYVLDTATVVGIAFAAFVIGALLTGALWFIYSHTGRFTTCCSLICQSGLL